MVASKRLDIRYTPLPSATPEGERSALADCYRIILEDYEAQQTTEGGAQDEHTTKDATGVNAD